MNATPALDEMKHAILYRLARPNAVGMPDVTPKALFDPYGTDSPVIADDASTTSVATIKASAKAGADDPVRRFISCVCAPSGLHVGFQRYAASRALH